MGLTNDEPEPYRLDAVIEYAAVFYSATRPKFYGRVGRHLDEECLSNGPGGFDGQGEPRKAMKAVHEAAHRNKRNGTTSLRSAMQVVCDWAEDRIITLDFRKRICSWLLEGPEEAPVHADLPPEEEVANMLVPLLKRRAQDAAVDEVFDIAQSRGDLSRGADRILQADKIGEDEGWDEAGPGTDMFARIRALKSVRRLPTPIVDLNDKLLGGLPIGQYGIVAAPSGVGKSTFLISLIADAMREGMRCALVTNELPLEYHYARLYANLTATPFNDVMDGRCESLVNERLGLLDGHRRLGIITSVRMPAGHTVAEVERWLDEKEQEDGEAFDLLVVDYQDRMSGGKDSDGDYLGQKHVTGGLRRIAEERKKWVWSATQVQDRQDIKILTGRHLSDSQWKKRLVHVGVSINPRGEVGQTLCYHVWKNTAGPDNLTTGEIPHDKHMARIAPVRDDLW